jgi:Mrp family chromosome partitioning ATPase
MIAIVVATPDKTAPAAAETAVIKLTSIGDSFAG